MSIVSIGEVLVDSALFDARFCCVLDSCRGACCIEGELGAPLLPEEVQPLRDTVGPLRELIAESHLRDINRHGCAELYQGDWYTRTVGGRACVFVTYRDGTALCAIEDGARQGLVSGSKPLSCRLFPIRVRKKFGLDYLVYEQHPMCRDAFREGAEKGILLIDLVGDALTELYGVSWYRALKAFVESSNGN